MPALRLAALVCFVGIAVVLVSLRVRNTGSAAPRVTSVIDATAKGAERPAPNKGVRSVDAKAARTTGLRAQRKRVDDAWIPANRSGPPVATIRESLLTAARAGDSEAASELSLATQFCRWAKEQGDVPDSTPLFVPDGNWNALSEDERAEDLRLIDNWRSARAAIERNRWYCAGMEAIVADDRAMLDAELMAARLGDAQAADCFVSSAAMLATPGTHMGPNPEYDAAVAKHLAEAALEIALQGIDRGDWRMVAVLAAAYSSGGVDGYSFVLAQPDPARHYAYAALLQLGHTDPEQLGREREFPLDPAELGIDIETARAMEDWAEDTYEHYFLNSEPLPYPSYTVCDPP